MPCRSPASRRKDGWTSREIMLLIALIGTHCTDTRAQYLMPCWSPALQSKDGWMLKLLAWQEMTARTHCRKEKMQRAFSLCGSSTQALIAIMTRHRMRLINQVLQVDPCRYTWNILALFLFFQLDFVCQNLKFLLRQAERLGKFCFMTLVHTYTTLRRAPQDLSAQDSMFQSVFSQRQSNPSRVKYRP